MYKDEEVPRSRILEMLTLANHAPTGGNRQEISFRVTFRKQDMDIIRERFYERIENAMTDVVGRRIVTRTRIPDSDDDLACIPLPNGGKRKRPELLGHVGVAAASQIPRFDLQTPAFVAESRPPARIFPALHSSRSGQ